MSMCIDYNSPVSIVSSSPPFGVLVAYSLGLILHTPVRGVHMLEEPLLPAGHAFVAGFALPCVISHLVFRKVYCTFYVLKSTGMRSASPRCLQRIPSRSGETPTD